MQQQQEDLDEVVDVFQEAQAISDEINYQQDQINDIINQNTDQITGDFSLRLIYKFFENSIFVSEIIYFLCHQTSFILGLYKPPLDFPASICQQNFGSDIQL